MEKLNNSQSRAALVQSINEGIKVKSQTRFQRINKRSQNDGDANTADAQTSENVSSEPQPSTSSARADSATTRSSAKKLKNSDERKSEHSESANDGDASDDLDVIFKPHPSEGDWSLTKFFGDDLKRFLKTSSNATGTYDCHIMGSFLAYKAGL